MSYLFCASLIELHFSRGSPLEASFGKRLLKQACLASHASDASDVIPFPYFRKLLPRLAMEPPSTLREGEGEEPPRKQQRTVSEEGTGSGETAKATVLPSDLSALSLSEYVSLAGLPNVLDPTHPLESETSAIHAAKLAGFRAAVAARGAALILLAAGQGSRFQAPIPKVVHPFAGKPLARHGLDAGAAVCLPTIVVVGHARELVRKTLAVEDKEQVVLVCQEQQMGTGHAVYLAKFALPHRFDGDIVISYADNPGVDQELLEELLAAHENNKKQYGGAYGAMVLTGSRKAAGQGAAAYGRIVRKNKDGTGPVLDIVEKKTITKLREENIQRTYDDVSWAAHELEEIDEFNSGIVVARNRDYMDVLGGIVASQTKLKPPKYEYYATDFVQGLVKRGLIAEGHEVPEEDMWKLEGANTLEELHELERKRLVRETVEASDDEEEAEDEEE